MMQCVLDMIFQTHRKQSVVHLVYGCLRQSNHDRQSRTLTQHLLIQLYRKPDTLFRNYHKLIGQAVPVAIKQLLNYAYLVFCSLVRKSQQNYPPMFLAISMNLLSEILIVCYEDSLFPVGYREHFIIRDTPAAFENRIHIVPLRMQPGRNSRARAFIDNEFEHSGVSLFQRRERSVAEEFRREE